MTFGVQVRLLQSSLGTSMFDSVMRCIPMLHIGQQVDLSAHK